MQKEKDSKEKILYTACRLFALKGFKGTTIRDICKEAKTYQISINYYFQSKENLFKEALLLAYELSSLNEIDKNADKITPEEFIDLVVRNKIDSFFDKSEKSWFFRMLSQSFFERLEISTEILDKTLNKHEKTFKEATKKLLGEKRINNEKELDHNIEYGFFLVLSQLFTITFHPVINKQFIENAEPNSEKTEWLIQKIKKTLFDSLNYKEMEYHK